MRRLWWLTRMESQYHVQLLTEAVGSYFSPHALEEVIAANLGQDALRYQLGAYPHFHFDNSEIARSLAYVDEEHARIGAPQVMGSDNPGALAQAQRAAFGRLTHTVHDFYAHSNYVDLWLAKHGGLTATRADEIDGLDAALLDHAELVSGSFLLWFDPLYYLPGMRPLLRKLYLRPRSHEAMNLDSPAQGPKFAYAMVAAHQRTRFEFARAEESVRAAGGEEAIARFFNE
jgi:hypothetical protein